MVTYTFAAVLAIFLVAFLAGRIRSVGASGGDQSSLHSRPGYYGAYVAAWAGIPVFLLTLLWLIFQPLLLNNTILSTLPEARLEGLDANARNLLLEKIKTVANGTVFGDPDAAVLAAGERYANWVTTGRLAMFASVVVIGLLGLLFARSRIVPQFRARQRVERVLDGLMIVCSVLAILTTVGIVASLLFEAMRFFDRVPVSEFLFGLNWEPQIPIREDQVAASGAFGAVPVFTGTLLIAGIALLVAVPIGLLSAIYLGEYAKPRVRSVVKPILEFLAGIPTVVYGFFAVLTVAPALTRFGTWIGLEMAPNSAVAAGAVMGVMIIPFVSSLSDDALNAVPRTMRDGSYGLGATKGETILNVLLPAALPGIMGGILLAASRAIGETMIVVMAAGLIANLTVNPFEAVTTVTVQIVTLLIGDTSFDNPKTLSAFALGLMLFLVTLCLNVIALRIVQKYREKYE